MLRNSSGSLLAGPAPAGIALRLGAFYGAVFAFIGVQLPFWPVWLKGQGLDPAALGLVLSAPVWLRLFMPLVAPWVDRSGLRRQAIVAGMWLSVAALATFGLVSGFWPLLLVSIWLGLAFGPLVPLADNLTMLHVYAWNLDYGRIRLWGSVTFILANLAAGALLGDFAVDVILFLLLALAVIGGLIALALPAAPGAPAAAAGAAAPRPDVTASRPLHGLLRQPLFLLFMAAGALGVASHAMLYAFGSLHWQAAGIPDAADRPAPGRWASWPRSGCSRCPTGRSGCSARSACWRWAPGPGCCAGARSPSPRTWPCCSCCSCCTA